jgi:hypothetical protein
VLERPHNGRCRAGCHCSICHSGLDYSCNDDEDNGDDDDDDDGNGGAVVFSFTRAKLLFCLLLAAFNIEFNRRKYHVWQHQNLQENAKREE